LTGALIPIIAWASPDEKPKEGMLGAPDKARSVAQTASDQTKSNEKLLNESRLAMANDLDPGTLFKSKKPGEFVGRRVVLTGKVLETGLEDGLPWMKLSCPHKNARVTLHFDLAGSEKTWKKGDKVEFAALFESSGPASARSARDFHFVVPSPTPVADPMFGWVLRGYVTEGPETTAVFNHPEKGKRYVRQGQLIEPGLRFHCVKDLQAQVTSRRKTYWLSPW
jgi:hypothetical protein